MSKNHISIKKPVQFSTVFPKTSQTKITDFDITKASKFIDQYNKAFDIILQHQRTINLNEMFQLCINREGIKLNKFLFKLKETNNEAYINSLDVVTWGMGIHVSYDELYDKNIAYKMKEFLAQDLRKFANSFAKEKLQEEQKRPTAKVLEFPDSPRTFSQENQSSTFQETVKKRRGQEKEHLKQEKPNPLQYKLSKKDTGDLVNSR